MSATYISILASSLPGFLPPLARPSPPSSHPQRCFAARPRPAPLDRTASRQSGSTGGRSEAGRYPLPAAPTAPPPPPPKSHACRRRRRCPSAVASLPLGRVGCAPSPSSCFARLLRPFLHRHHFKPPPRFRLPLHTTYLPPINCPFLLRGSSSYACTCAVRLLITTSSTAALSFPFLPPRSAVRHPSRPSPHLSICSLCVRCSALHAWRSTLAHSLSKVSTPFLLYPSVLKFAYQRQCPKQCERKAVRGGEGKGAEQTPDLNTAEGFVQREAPQKRPAARGRDEGKKWRQWGEAQYINSRRAIL